jgi:hypothetical protein
MLRHSWLGVLLVVCAIVSPVKGEVQLRWKFHKGDKFYLESASELKQTSKIEGTSVPVQLETTTVAGYTVKDVTADGTVTLEQKIESIKVKASDKLTGADKIEKLKGAMFTLTLDAQGKITRFEGYEEFIKRLTTDEKFGQNIKALINKDTLSKGAEEAFSFLPEKPIKDGAKWNKTVTVPLGPVGSFKVENTYTNEGKTKEGPIKIELRSVMTYKLPEEKTEGLNFKVTGGDLKSEGAGGTILFDPDKGRLVKYDSKVKLKGSLTIETNGKPVTLDFEQDQNTTVRLLDKAPAE